MGSTVPEGEDVKELRDMLLLIESSAKLLLKEVDEAERFFAVVRAHRAAGPQLFIMPRRKASG